MHARHCYPIGFIEMRDAFGVLPLAVLDDHSVGGKVGVYGKFHRTSRLIRVAPEPVEAVLTSCILTKNVLTEVDDIGLVA